MQRDCDDAISSRSGARHWAPIAKWIGWEASLSERVADCGRIARFTYEFLRFGVKQAWASLFAGLLLTALVLTHLAYPSNALLPRYDFLVIAAVAIQVGMLAAKLETVEEAKIIFVFHIVGTVMEIFKTSAGSWIYPEASILRIGGVPLFTGFMYAAVGSYIARCWRLFDFQFTRHPPLWTLAALSIAIYANFFSHHYIRDARNLLFLTSAILIGPCIVHYKLWRVHRSMPLLLGLVLVALFIWFAENIGTFASAWVYPNQKHGWAPVSIGKLGSWFLLMIISYTLVASINHPRRYREKKWPANMPAKFGGGGVEREAWQE